MTSLDFRGNYPTLEAKRTLEAKPEQEVEEFLEVKSREENIDFPLDVDICKRVKEVSGGLPLAIQWIIGQYKIERKINTVLNSVNSEDSPVLEFSFGNIWRRLSNDAQLIMAVLSIFETPPTIQQIAIATEYPSDKIIDALTELEEVTLIRKITQQSDGSIVYAALPITLSFAENQLAQMGAFELNSRRRLEKFNAQLELQETELQEFRVTIQRYGLTNENTKKAAVLCRRAGHEAANGNFVNASTLYRQARELAPQSAYVYAMTAQYELSSNKVESASKYAKEAVKRCDKKTGSLCHVLVARIQERKSDWNGAINSFKKALEFEPDNTLNRHQYGVLLSKRGRTQEAIDEFSKIIENEKERRPIRKTLLMALKTRIINFKRLGKHENAQADLDFAKEILDCYPYMQDEAWHIQDLE